MPKPYSMFGFRPDGKKVKDIDPIQRIIPHIMPTRNDAQNMTEYDCPCEPMDAFIIQQSDKGTEYTYMHLLIAAMVRVYARFPHPFRPLPVQPVPSLLAGKIHALEDRISEN